MTLSLGATSQLQRWFTAAAHWPEAVLPDWDGGSIANLPASILSGFTGNATSVQHRMLPPLRSSVLDPDLLRGARVVVVLVVDGLGQESLRWADSRGALTHINSAPFSSSMTSIFPSTTVAALTTLQTGLAPATHGMAGYTLYLPEQRAAINMIGWKAVGGLPMKRPLPPPHGFLGQPTLYDILNDAGVPSTVVSSLALTDSALTNVQSAGVPYSGYRTGAEFAGLLLREVEKPGQRFVFGYWDTFDVLSHTHGPESPIVLDELHLLDSALGRGFFNRLTSKHGDVAVILTADHGHAPIADERTHSLRKIFRDHSPERLIPTGDRRAMGLAFNDPSALQDIRDLVNDDGVLLSVHRAVEAGLYGPGERHRELEPRIGKTLLLAKDDASFVFPQSSNPTAGGHGSLNAREMRVPLAAWRGSRNPTYRIA